MVASTYRGAPLAIGENDLLEPRTCTPWRVGYLVGRGGQTNYNATPIGGHPVKSLYRFYKQDGQGIMLAAQRHDYFSGNDGPPGFFVALSGGYTREPLFFYDLDGQG